ncbi:hypothetical protein B0H19DRAFT_1275026 [Mycena capillaripes]|nr:hypothetical protein B0H19DRAFT_1275026 [Mycena capillaripes]
MMTGQRAIVPSIVYGDPSEDIDSFPSVSVEIGSWDGTEWATADLPCVEQNIIPVDEAPDMDAHLG